MHSLRFWMQAKMMPMIDCWTYIECPKSVEVIEFILFESDTQTFTLGEVKQRTQRQNSLDEEANQMISKETIDNIKWIEKNITITDIDS